MTAAQAEFPFAANSETSKDAARNLNRRKAEDDRAMILACIKSRRSKGCTDREIQDELGMSGDTERPRRNELAGNGRTSGAHKFWPIHIKQSGERRNGGAVWVAMKGLS